MAMKCSISTYYKILDAELYNYDDGYMQLNVDINAKSIDIEDYVSKQKRRIDMDKSLYNASGCKDRTAHDAICAADRTRTLVYRVSRTKKDEEAELFVKMVKRLAKGFGFKLCDRIKFEDPETGKKYL